jgi:putative ATP-dependent endonuclease of OLD family
MYQDNKNICDNEFSVGRLTLSVQEFMLKNKTDAAFKLLEKHGAELVSPAYIKKAVQWIRA